MEKPEYHIFVCNSFRLSGEQQGICYKLGAPNLMGVLEEEIIDRGIDAMISSTSCLKVCDRGPAMVIYPNNWWYGKVTEESLDEILDALEEGECVESMLIC